MTLSTCVGESPGGKMASNVREGLRRQQESTSWLVTCRLMGRKPRADSNRSRRLKDEDTITESTERTSMTLKPASPNSSSRSATVWCIRTTLVIVFLDARSYPSYILWCRPR